MRARPRPPGRACGGGARDCPSTSANAISLGEGITPLVRLPRVAHDVGVKELYVKNEAANPTGSLKDRLAALAVAAARQVGAHVVAGASTGNHGAALAAYCAHAGLRCVIFTTAAIPVRDARSDLGDRRRADRHGRRRCALRADRGARRAR